MIGFDLGFGPRFDPRLDSRLDPRLDPRFDSRLDPGFDYSCIPGLSNEIVEKLSRIRPRTLGQASRISGVTPAAVTTLMIYLRSLRKNG